MNKKLLGIVILVIILAGVVAVLFMKNPAKAPSENNSNTSNSSNTTNTSTSDTTNQQNTSPVTTDKVEIKDFAFSPGTITVKKGTTVTWTNQDTTRHNISPDNETNEFKASSLLAKGESYSVTFNTIGTFSYHCTPHPYMKAQVVVTE